MSLPSQPHAGAEPISLSYAKTFLRVDHDHEDQLISDLITLSRIRVEQMTCHVLITRSDAKVLPIDCPATLKLSITPLVQVEGICVTDANGSEHEIDAGDYDVIRKGDCTHICLTRQSRWSAYSEDGETVVIRYTAGFGPSSDDVPHPFRQAILLLVGQSYEHRGSTADLPAPMMVDALLMPYRKFWI